MTVSFTQSVVILWTSADPVRSICCHCECACFVTAYKNKPRWMWQSLFKSMDSLSSSPPQSLEKSNYAPLAFQMLEEKKRRKKNWIMLNISVVVTHECRLWFNFLTIHMRDLLCKTSYWKLFFWLLIPVF